MFVRWETSFSTVQPWSGETRPSATITPIAWSTTACETTASFSFHTADDAPTTSITLTASYLGAEQQATLSVARNIYRTESLERYGFQSHPSIRIIVKNGRVRLEGIVDSEADKTIAGLKAREIGGVFEVTNNLTVER